MNTDRHRFENQDLVQSACNTFHIKNVVSIAHGTRMTAYKLPVDIATNDNPVSTGVSLSGFTKWRNRPKKQPKQKAARVKAKIPNNIAISQCLVLSRGSVSADDTRTPMRTQPIKRNGSGIMEPKINIRPSRPGASDQAKPLPAPNRILRVQIFSAPIRIPLRKCAPSAAKSRGKRISQSLLTSSPTGKI